MKNITRAKKPLWAIGWQAFLVGCTSFMISAAAFTGCYEVGKGWLESHLTPLGIAKPTIDSILSFLTGIYMGGAAWVMNFIVSWIRTVGFPGTYIYTFKRTDAVGERVAVVGHFSLSCNASGGLIAKGDSYDWKNGKIDGKSRVPWRSQIVDGYEDPAHGRTTCIIIYDVVQDNKSLRPYELGLLIFEYTKEYTGIVKKDHCFIGTMQAVDEEKIFEPAYCEKVSGKWQTLKKKEVLGVFDKHGKNLIRRYNEVNHNT